MQKKKVFSFLLLLSLLFSCLGALSISAAEESATATVIAHGLAANDTLQLRYLICFDSEVTDKTAVFTVTDPETGEQIGEKISAVPLLYTGDLLPDYQGVICYEYILPLSAKQLTDQVTVSFEGNSEVSNEPAGSASVTIQDYCLYQIERSSDARVRRVCAAIMVYGYQTQKVFNYHTDRLPAVTEELCALAATAHTWKDAIGSTMTLQSEKRQLLAEGVTYTERIYQKQNGEKLKAYITVIEPDAQVAMKVAALPYREDTGKNEVQTVEQLAQASGEDVLVAVNGGFFRHSEKTYVPYGMVIADGVVLQAPDKSQPAYTDRWFGVTTDGEYVISDTDGYQNTYYGQIAQGVGGGLWLIKNGTVTAPDSVLAPRTTVGYCTDGTLVLLCVDGKSDKSGASYHELVELYAGLDVTVSNMLNLDGGGSTTVVTATENGTLSVCNTPSDGSQRPVPDCILIVKKSERTN